ncbi:helix-turn-helix transcriptional regulator [Ottowia thiooxydans]|uniref:helix-turn-helix transcriptional regulator n=1 Tax=Ottowia thiooxydans TaxID=219182 RepID=UPI00041675F3|nr:LuxR C-terminal-related transcriptional regulator [Ottowia thiooxydans]
MLQDVRTRITGLLYDGVMSPQDWYEGIDTMRDALGAGVFHFFTLGPADAGVIDSVDNQGTVGIHSEKLREYETHHIGHDLRMAVLMNMPLGHVMLDHEHIGARERSRNMVYADFLEPHGFRHTLGALVRDEGGARDFLGFLRPRDHTHYGASDNALMQQLMPDLMRAARLRSRMGQLAQNAALGSAALHSLPQGIALVDASCRIQYSNPAAERWLGNKLSPLGVRHGQLRCLDDAAQRRLHKLVAQNCGPGMRGPAGALQLIGSPARLVVTVLPLKASHVAALHQAPLALIVLVDPDASGGLSPELVTDMLGLSPAEARLALLLAAGKTIKDYAAMEACSWHTARTHLKNLMRKTGCHRQTDLVRLLQSVQLA